MVRTISGLLVVSMLVACGPSTSSKDGTDGGSAQKHVFITSATYAGDFKTLSAKPDGLTGADALCTTVAHGAGLTGTYKAWLSSDTVNAIDRLADVGPWYQFPTGKSPVLTFQNKAALAGTPDAAIDTDEKGGVQDLACVWTGTLATGDHAAATCAGWTSANTFDFGTITQNDAATWSAGGSCGGATQDSCVAAHHVYCFEQ